MWKKEVEGKKESFIDSVITDQPLLDLPSSHIRRPLQKLEMSSLFLTPAGKKDEATNIHSPHPVPGIFKMTHLTDQSQQVDTYKHIFSS